MEQLFQIQHFSPPGIVDLSERFIASGTYNLDYINVNKFYKLLDSSIPKKDDFV
jgi:hypothetical protein